MNIPFTDFFERLRKATGIASQTELARALGINRSAITQAKMRNAVPQKWILILSRRYSLSADWLEFGGTGAPGQQSALNAARTAARAAGPGNAGGGLLRPMAAPPAVAEELIYIPKAAARLCAGGGSFEVESATVGEYPMPSRWLSRLGSPSHMVFMDVVGDSMEPGIMDGDTVLIDRANMRHTDGGILAVGFEDAIYLKRVEKKNDCVLLHSDNEAYVPMKIYGDELDSFRIIGRVVWLCRDTF